MTIQFRLAPSQTYIQHALIEISAHRSQQTNTDANLITLNM